MEREFEDTEIFVILCVLCDFVVKRTIVWVPACAGMTIKSCGDEGVGDKGVGDKGNKMVVFGIQS